MDNLLPRLSKKAYNQTADKTLAIVFYELGKVTELSIKEAIYGCEGVSAYYCPANQQKELSDTVTMLRLYCEQRGWNFEDILHLGEESYNERQYDMDNYGK